MIRLKELLTQIAEKQRAARMAEADAQTAAKFAGMQNRDDVELATVREPASPEMQALGQKHAFEPSGPTVQKAIEKDKRSGMQSDNPLKAAYDAKQKKLKDREVFQGVRGKIQDLPPEIQPMAQAKQDKYSKNMAAAQSEFDAWDKERKDTEDKEQAQKAAVKAASVKQKGDKYMNTPGVGNVELPKDGDEVDVSTLDQGAVDAVKTAYQDFMRYKPSGAEASDYMRLLLRKYKLPPNTNPFGTPPQS